MHTERIVAAGGITLDVATSYEAGAPTVLFVNAIGMENRLLEGPARALRAAGLNLVTWELRGSPGPSRSPRVTLSEHAADGLAVAAALGTGPLHVAGWCTGASIGLFLTRALGGRALSFTAVDGAFLFDGVPGARLGNAVFDMCTQIAADEDRAGVYLDIVRPRGNEAQVMGIEDEDLVGMVTYPYSRGTEELIRYAHGIRAANDYDPAAACAALPVPALFLAREDDQMVGYRNSRRAGALVARSELSVRETGGHYALFTDPAQAAGELAAFAHRVGSPGRV
ncbi:alpha/beta hydrolase [Streptomyces sp. NPDC016469]|uniref:alpha/beta fold hydrolase n=1 Tax=Streptomyces sp. NPDC016469 TaxID=3157191 RepID=UPI0033F7C2FD